MSFYDVLGVEKNASNEEIIKAYWTKASVFVQNREDEEARRNYDHLNEVYSTLMDPASRKKYNEQLDKEDSRYLKDIGGYNYTFSGEPKFEQRRRCVSVHYAYTQLDGKDNILKEGHRKSFALEPLYQSLKAFEQLVDNLNNKAKVKDNYRPLALEMQKLYDGINSKIHGLQFHAESFHAFEEKFFGVERGMLLKTLLECQKNLKLAQQNHKDLMKAHRGFLRTTPIIKEMLTCLDAVSNALANTIIFIINQFKSNNSKLSYFKLFQPPKTKTTKEIEEVAEDIDAQIAATQ